MYCPKCKKKQYEELLICKDCNTSLMPELPPLSHEHANFSRLHSPASSSELLMIKSILAKEDINYYTTNDKYSPDIELNKGCMVMVQDGHLKKAQNILTDYNIYIQNNYSKDQSPYDNPRKTLKGFLFGWVPGKKKE